MGRLTDSLRSATKRVDRIQEGVRKMQDIGADMAENTLSVADAALRTGYAYAKIEAERAIAEIVLEEDDRKALPAAEVRDPYPDNMLWTEEALKEKFGNFHAAYRHLKECFGITLTKRSWKTIVAAFNQPQTSLPPSLDDRLTELERIVTQQGQYIALLEQKIAAISR